MGMPERAPVLIIGGLLMIIISVLFLTADNVTIINTDIAFYIYFPVGNLLLLIGLLEMCDLF